MMLCKNRNKKVGFCVMVVASCFILTTFWAIMATPETAQAGKPAGDNYEMIITTDPPEEPSSLLTNNGDGSLWTFFTRTTVEPTGSGYLIGVGKPGVVLMFKEQQGVIESLTIAGNDADRVWHVSDVIPVYPPIIETDVIGKDFDVVINADNINVHRRNKSGPVIGTIAIGTIQFTVVP